MLEHLSAMNSHGKALCYQAGSRVPASLWITVDLHSKYLLDKIGREVYRQKLLKSITLPFRNMARLSFHIYIKANKFINLYL